jgi:simple sugar transport system ATP-binding protein
LRTEKFFRAVDLTKTFEGIVALKHINIDVAQGEVVGLVGDNGAGKSTFVKLVSGVYRPDSGYFLINGKKFERLTTSDCQQLGITIVHQESTTADKQTIWRNVFLGKELTYPLGFLKINEMKRRTAELLEGLGFAAERATTPDNVLRNLSGGFRQGIQLARALDFTANLAILDEPTVGLSLAESQIVLDFVSKIKEKGKSVILISHNIYHLYPVADRFVILDRGSKVGEFLKKDMTIDDMSRVLISIARTGHFPKEFEDKNIDSNPIVRSTYD